MTVLQKLTAFVINLDRSPERLRAVTEALHHYGINWERVAAVDGHKLDLDQTPEFSLVGYRRLHGKEINRAEVGCYLSHVRAFRQFLASDHQYALILEDDAVFYANPSALLASLMAQSQHWDVAKLSGYHSGSPVSLCALDGEHDLCVAITKHTGANAYLVNRHAAQTYVERLLPMKLPYDHAFDRPWLYGLKFRMVNPALCRPDASGVLPSTISDSRQNKLPAYRRISVVLYRAVNELLRVAYGLAVVLRHRLGAGR
jgi:glycosyl transferase family 25